MPSATLAVITRIAKVGPVMEGTVPDARPALRNPSPGRPAWLSDRTGPALSLRFAAGSCAPVSRQITPIYVVLALTVIAAAAFTLHQMGQVTICKCGYVELWHGDPNSSGNSQHIFDWYTLSHVIHGFLFFMILSWVAKPLPLGVRFLAATVVEAGWEIFENTDYVINRYREATISLDYYGDSVINSVSDIAVMMVGFVLAWRLPIWASVAVVIAFELIALYMIRDNLALNILMLLWPVDAVREWQAAG